ncbi:MAG TPA: glycosyltransferase [Anaerolineae bacterium]|nr:glycosyltransferase [Anaerolineae bacterium]
MSLPKRVAMLSMHTSPVARLGGKETGGMNVYVRELTRALALHGIAIDIFTRAANPHAPAVDTESIGVQNTRVININAGPRAPISKHALAQYVGEFADGIRRFAASENISYDIWHAHYWLSGMAAECLNGMGLRAPIIQMFHTLGELKNRAARNASEAETDTRIWTERELMRGVTRVIASTPRDREQMIELYDAPPEKIVVIPPGVDTNLFHPVPSARAREWIGSYDEKMVLFVGRIDPIKGLDTWFRAMKLVVDQDPTLRQRMCVCLIGGDLDDDLDPDSELSRLVELKEELGIGELVTFLGGRAQTSLPFYYSAADAVVMPSRYESFGLAALEAMACGTPVVASDVGGLSYLVRDAETGFLVPEGAADAFAEKISLLLHNPQLRNEMGKRGIAEAQEYSWWNIAERIIELYEDMLKK